MDLEKAHAKWRESGSNFTDLYTGVKPIIEKALTSYAPSSKDIVRGQAKLLTMRALKSYDPAKNVKLQTHLMSQLRPLIRVARRRSSPITLPERVMIDIYKINDKEKELTDKLRRQPTDQELADKLGLSTKRIAYVRERTAKPVVPESAFETTTNTGFQKSSPVARASNKHGMWLEFVYQGLDPTDKLILEWRTGLHGKRKTSNMEIARRLKLTPSAISQRTKKLIAKLEEGVNL